MFLPRRQELTETPPPETTSIPESKGGTLVYGAIRVGPPRGGGRSSAAPDASGPADGDGSTDPTAVGELAEVPLAGRIPFAVEIAPVKERGDEGEARGDGEGGDTGADEEAGPWRLYVDRDLDKGLADERPYEARPKVEEREVAPPGGGAGRKVRNSGAAFPAVEVVLPGGAVHAYSISVVASGGAGDRRGPGPSGRGKGAVAGVRSAVGLAARTRLFGRDATVSIYDSNANGRFGDLYRSPYFACDDVAISFAGGDRARPRPLARRVLGPVLQEEGETGAAPRTPGTVGRRAAELTITVDEGRPALTIEELDVSLGAIARAGGNNKDEQKDERVEVQLSSVTYGLLGPISAREVPEGTHRLLGFRFARRGEDGRQWLLAGTWLTHPPPAVEVSASSDGPPAEVPFGPPLDAPAALAFLEGKDEVLVRVALRGSGNEEVAVASRKGVAPSPAEAAEGEKQAPPQGEAATGSFRVLDRNDDRNDGGNGGGGGGPDEKELGSGKLHSHPLVPGLWLSVWRPARPAGPQIGPAIGPAEGIDDGRKLALEAAFDLGPFADGLTARTDFEFGRSTPMVLAVAGVDRGTQADSAGVARGDVIVSYDGKRVRNQFELGRAFNAALGKDRVKLVVRRRSGRGTGADAGAGAGEETTRSFTLRPGRIGVQVVPIVPGRGAQ